MHNDLVIFCDFDGTISTRDIGYDLFARFGSQDPLHDRLLSGAIGIRDYWRAVVGTLREPPTPEMLDPYLLSIPPDVGLNGLLDLAERRGIPFTILSDGLSFYVERYLHLHGIRPLPLVCNDARLGDDGAVTVSFPHAVDGCGCMSAVCKRAVVLTRSAPEQKIIYIGDGVSDFCPAECADIIFAKGKLAAYCNANGLPHHSWTSLREVSHVIDRLIRDKKIRGRRQAELVRKRGWESG